MGKENANQCVFPLTSLQIGDLQSYLSELSFFLAFESKKFYILVDNRPWLGNFNLRPAQLWQLMVTKSRSSPFANTKARRQKKKGKQARSKDENSETKKLEKWSSLIDAASSSHKKVLLPVKNLRKSLQLSSELHRTLYGFIVFEVEWDNVRGINYLNELQTDTCLALEAKLMKRWEFDSITQAAGCMSSWFTGTVAERRTLKDYLNASAGDIFYDAEEEFPRSHIGRCEEICSSDPYIGENSPTSAGSRFSVFSAFNEDSESGPHTPPLKRRRVTKFTKSDGELDFCSDEKRYESEDSIDSSSAPDAENSVDIFEYRDILMIFRFNDHDLPFKLRQVIMSDLRLLTLLESGLPSWVIFLQSYPVFCHLYRPWMCPLARALYVIISVVTVLIGFYDLYKNVPVLKATAAHLCGPLFDWIETWEMVTRIKYLGTMLFLHNCQKALKWFLMMTSTTRSFFFVLVQPLVVPLLELFHSLFPLWSVLSQAVYSSFSIVWMIIGSICSLVAELVEVLLQPLWFLLSLVWTIGNSILYPIFWMLCETLYLPIRMVLTLANTIAFIGTYTYGSIIEVWQSVSGVLKIASATNTAVNRTYEVSKWRLLWSDLFSQVFRALRTILNGFVAFFTTCNRHRLSIYNHMEVMIQKYFHRTQRLNSLDRGHHRSNLQPKSPSAGRRKSHHHGHHGK
ncbi:uncharacterized protein LOC116195529 [Punica granatum]|uniref:Uncharacterized protein LOC116195529 n=1 Tax=Punica granatum TaxID=22663 RepID=A0A6P8CIX8_PUNGR|nr:uncharacterized protein LOC116195529 [Punica granatum]XP_031380638.1 uncharacterized protein LOC116195529 [Punica granatum]